MSSIRPSGTYSPTGSLMAGMKRPASSLSHDEPASKRVSELQLELTTPVNQVVDSRQLIDELANELISKISTANQLTLSNSLAHRSIYANKDSVGLYNQIIELINKINSICFMPEKKYELLNALYNRAQIVLNICMQLMNSPMSNQRFTIAGSENTSEGFLNEQYQILRNHYSFLTNSIDKKNWQTVMGQIAALHPHNKNFMTNGNNSICGNCAASEHFLQSAIMPGHSSNAYAEYNAGRLAQSYLLTTSIHGEEDCLSEIQAQIPPNTDPMKSISSASLPQDNTYEWMEKIVDRLVQENIRHPIEARPIEEKTQMIFRCKLGISIARSQQEPRIGLLLNKLYLIQARGVLSRYIEWINQVPTLKEFNKKQEMQLLIEAHRFLDQNFASQDAPDNESFRQQLMSSIARYLPAEYLASLHSGTQAICTPCISITNQLVAISTPRKRKTTDSFLSAQHLAASYRVLPHEYRGCISPFIENGTESLPPSALMQLIPMNPNAVQKNSSAFNAIGTSSRLWYKNS